MKERCPIASGKRVEEKRENIILLHTDPPESFGVCFVFLSLLHGGLGFLSFKDLVIKTSRQTREFHPPWQLLFFLYAFLHVSVHLANNDNLQSINQAAYEILESFKLEKKATKTLSYSASLLCTSPNQKIILVGQDSGGLLCPNTCPKPVWSDGTRQCPLVNISKSTETPTLNETSQPNFTIHGDKKNPQTLRFLLPRHTLSYASLAAKLLQRLPRPHVSCP